MLCNLSSAGKQGLKDNIGLEARAHSILPRTCSHVKGLVTRRDSLDWETCRGQDYL